MAMADEEQRDKAWGTLEELLLACAISRHGIESWDFIAMEVQKRSTSTRYATCKKSTHNNIPKAFTSHECEQRYQALKCRFVGENYAVGERDLHEKLPLMIDELRRLRVEELRREVERHDVSIVSLQSKVKRLEERKRNSLNPEDEADLRNRIDEQDGSKAEAASKSVLRESSDRSMNESYSTSQRAVLAQGKENGEPDPVRESLETEPDKVIGRASEAVRLSKAGELRSASLSTRKRRRSNEIEVEKLSSPANKRVDVKSHPLIKFLEIVRPHKHGLVFQRRLPSQKTQKYKNLIRQHMDVETVESKLHRSLYCDSSQFYRDLLLIFTNAVLFFPKSSTEHLAARELRRLVTIELIAARKPKPNPAANNKKPPPSNDIVVCRRRRNVSIEAVKNGGLKADKPSSGDDHRKKNGSNGKDTPMKLKRDRSSNLLRTSSNSISADDDASLAPLSQKSRRKEAAVKPSKEEEQVKKKVVVVANANANKMDEAPKTMRVSGRRPVSSNTTAKKNPRR